MPYARYGADMVERLEEERNSKVVRGREKKEGVMTLTKMVSEEV